MPKQNATCGTKMAISNLVSHIFENVNRTATNFATGSPIVSKPTSRITSLSDRKVTKIRNLDSFRLALLETEIDLTGCDS